MGEYFESTWEKEREKRYIFPVVCDSDMKNLCRIHPLNQKKADCIYRAVYDDPCIALTVIFGSSLNHRCNQESDIDIAVKLKEGSITNDAKSEISEKIQTACDWTADILWRDRLTEADRILHEIRKGVILV